MDKSFLTGLLGSLILVIGAALIALFSFMEASWTYFWVNTFFAIFSAYYLVKAAIASKD